MIKFFSYEIVYKPKRIRQIRELVRHILGDFDRLDEEVDFIFVTDDYLLSVNKDFLHHDYYTDTITFLYSKKKDRDIIAEVFISRDRVKENARLYNQSFHTEILRVIIHSTLHLVGFSDKGKSAKKMEQLQEQYLEIFLSQVSRGTK
jgi:rRNA maturation RNase YbeY